ncbi:MAG TPA: RNA 2',3'-cyclic phosphodiesterase [Sedimentisphaerales bacterium]|nr:RNA 2',3'-cyclic phosphodiesterase [Sedimentisphaerales bacterium]
MRCFIAIDISEQIRKSLAKLQNELRGKADIRKGDVKWVDPGAIHLTLKFLGEIKAEQSVDVCKAAQDVAGRHHSFELDVEEVGHFGGASARVLWVGAGQNCSPLVQLNQDLEQQLELAGWPKEGREFSAHLTLCRVRNAKAGTMLVQTIRPYKDLKLGSMPADSLSVYQSELTPKGPIYTTLGNYRLQ